jgi:nitroimidazol reductase NimA-like FMN-containing flavoprotein (pyridoxamine 5'-phosphate oxidase superfamily)
MSRQAAIFVGEVGAMLIHELTTAQCREVLSRTSLGRLACARGAQPYVVPVSYTYDADSDCLFCFSAVGKKVNWMRENPNVCVEVEAVDDRFHWTTVVLFGRYDEIGDSPEQKDIRHRALHLFQQRSEWWLPGGATSGHRQPHAMVMYRIHIDSLTGRRASRDTK